MATAIAQYTVDGFYFSTLARRPNSSSNNDRDSCLTMQSSNVLDTLFPDNDIFSSMLSPVSFVSTKKFPIDIKETTTAFEIHADMPGLVKNEIKISVNDGIMTITADRIKTKKEENEKFYREERIVGHVSRSLTLPNNVDDSKIDAKYEDGVLTVIIPKSHDHPVDKSKIIAVK